MLTKAVLAVLVSAASIYGGSQLIDDIKPVAERTASETTIRSVLEMALIQESLNGSSRSDAIALAVRMTPNAEGMYTEGEYVVYNVVDTCLKGHLGEYDKKIIEAC